jgi:hypothetical protein
MTHNVIRQVFSCTANVSLCCRPGWRGSGPTIEQPVRLDPLYAIDNYKRRLCGQESWQFGNVPCVATSQGRDGADCPLFKLWLGDSHWLDVSHVVLQRSLGFPKVNRTL